jgi:glycosyltransferase involved in cell wall biosynthesis
VKIGILAFSPPGAGVYQYTQSIVDALKKDKTKNYIIFCNEGEDIYNNYGLEVRKVSIPKTNLIQKFVRVFQFFFFIRKPWFFTHNEIAKFSDIDLFVCPVVLAYPHFFLNKPFVFTLHDMQERYYPDNFSKYDNIIRWIVNRTLAKSANTVICESNFVKNDIVKFIGINEDKIEIIQSPPPEIFLNFKFEDKQFNVVREKYNLPENFVFYPAQCWFHKNHIKLVEAFKIVSKQIVDINLILTGSQKNNYNNLMQRVNKLNLNDKVKHLGYVDYEDLPYIYKMSKFLVMPTLFESVSIPIYEAFALEVAVCSSNTVALPEQVGNAGIIFNPNDEIEIANKMIMYLNDNDLRNEKAKLGLERVKDFNHENYKIKLLEVLNKV